jgi:hypothetical protein
MVAGLVAVVAGSEPRWLDGRLWWLGQGPSHLSEWPWWLGQSQDGWMGGCGGWDRGRLI